MHWTLRKLEHDNFKRKIELIEFNTECVIYFFWNVKEIGRLADCDEFVFMGTRRAWLNEAGVSFSN